MLILPCCPFPNVQWLQALLSSNEVCIDIGEHYVKQSYRNRIDILTAQGRKAFTVRVEGQKGVKTAVKDVRLIRDEWRRVLLRALQAAYASAPYYEHYIEGIEDVVMEAEDSLARFNIRSLSWSLDALGINWPLKVSENYIEARESDIDLRAGFKKIELSGKYDAYAQVFEDRYGFTPNLSVIDLLMNCGPAALDYIQLN